MSNRNKGYTNRNSDRHGTPEPVKKYTRLRPANQNKSGFCLLYFLVGFSLITLYIIS